MITKITYKFNDKSLARYRYKQKQNVWNLRATLVCSTQSPNLVTYSSYFRQVVGLCDRSSRIGCPGEALNSSLKLSSYFSPYRLYPHPKLRPPKWHVLHWIEENMKMQSQSSYMAKLSPVDVHFWTSGFIWHSSAELFASVQQLTIKSSAILSSIGIILYAHVLHRSLILSLRIASNNANSVLDSQRFWVSGG